MSMYRYMYIGMVLAADSENDGITLIIQLQQLGILLKHCGCDNKMLVYFNTYKDRLLSDCSTISIKAKCLLGSHITSTNFEEYIDFMLRALYVDHLSVYSSETFWRSIW